MITVAGIAAIALNQGDSRAVAAVAAVVLNALAGLLQLEEQQLKRPLPARRRLNHLTLTVGLAFAGPGIST